MPLTAGSALLQKTAEQSFWNSFFDIADVFDGLVSVRPSSQKTDTLTWLGAAPMPRVWSGSKQAKAVPEQSFTITNTPYEATVKIDKELIKYQQWDEVAKLLSNLGMKTRAHQAKLHATDISNNTAGACYDGQDFFDTDHKDVGAAYTTSQDNDLTGAAATATQPTDVELAAAIRSCVDKIYSYKDDQGDPFIAPDDNPANWIVMVPPVYRSVALRVQVADSLTGPVANDLKGRFTTRVNQFSAATDTFQLFYAGSTHKPFIRNEVEGVQLQDNMDGDEYMLTGDVTYSATWWGATDYGQWRTAVLYTFT